MSLVTIDVDGLEESIRCILCKNNMKTSRGCDGSCVVDDSILVKICDEISSRIERKYCWHDLIKNPDDLPKHDNWVLVVVNNMDKKSTAYFKNGHWNTYDLSCDTLKIVSWREI